MRSLRRKRIHPPTIENPAAQTGGPSATCRKTGRRYSKQITLGVSMSLTASAIASASSMGWVFSRNAADQRARQFGEVLEPQRLVSQDGTELMDFSERGIVN